MVHNGGGSLEFHPKWHQKFIVPKVRRLFAQVVETIRMKNAAHHSLLSLLSEEDVPESFAVLTDPGAPLLLLSALKLQQHLIAYLSDYNTAATLQTEANNVPLPQPESPVQKV